MSKLVDPHICPDCRAPLDTAGTCTACGLRLVGPRAAELWERMQQADRLIEQLRTVPATAAAAPSPAPPPGAPLRPVAPGARVGVPLEPAFPAPPLGRTHHRLPSPTVPVVLLALGGICLLVAAIVFVAVAWSSLSLAAKTTILLAITALFAAAAVAVTRRSLRYAAETLWLVVATLVVIDLSAAHHADLLGLGRLGDRDVAALVGAVLLGLAVGVGAWATASPLRRLHGLVVVSGVGTILLAGSEAWTSDHNPTAVAVSVPVLVGLAWAIDRVTDSHLRPTAAVVGCGALVSWLVLVANGVDRMSATATDSDWWSGLSGWPLLAASALAAVPAVLPVVDRRVPEWTRFVAAGGSLVTLALFAVGPSTGPTADLLSWAGVSVLIALVAAIAPTTWCRPAAALTALALVVWSMVALARPLAVIHLLPTTGSPDHADLGMRLPAQTGGAAPWTAIVAVLVVGATAAALTRHLPSAELREVAGRALIALGPGALALGAATSLLETEPALVVAVLAWFGTIALTAAMVVTVRRHDAALIALLLFVAYLVVVGLRLAVASHLLVATLATVNALVLALAYARAEGDLLRGTLRPALAAATVVLAGFAATHWPYVADGRGNAAGLSLVLVAAVALLLARPAGRGGPSRLAIEAAALVAGLAATTFPVDGPTVAMVLTVLGSAVAVTAVLNRDRDEAAWVAIALLGVATLIRVVDDVRAPEGYTLPAAALLLGAGCWRLVSDSEVGSVRALSAGLTLALLPSLLLALDEPVSLRGALVAAGGLAALAVGVVRLWAAPFVAGAATTGVLAVRHLGPVVDGLPRWISLGSVGLLLLLVGITWEQRRRDVAAASRYLASLG